VIDLSALKHLEDPKKLMTVLLYESTHDRLTEICKKENVKVTHLLRQLINTFISDYEKGGKK
jgi:hypothetical protein